MPRLERTQVPSGLRSSLGLAPRRFGPSIAGTSAGWRRTRREHRRVKSPPLSARPREHLALGKEVVEACNKLRMIRWESAEPVDADCHHYQCQRSSRPQGRHAFPTRCRRCGNHGLVPVPCAIHFSCSSTSCALWKRASGSFARHPLRHSNQIVQGSPAHPCSLRRAAGGSSFRTAPITLA